MVHSQPIITLPPHQAVQSSIPLQQPPIPQPPTVPMPKPNQATAVSEGASLVVKNESSSVAVSNIAKEVGKKAAVKTSTTKSKKKKKKSKFNKKVDALVKKWGAIEKQRAAEEKQQTPAYKKKKEIEKAEKWVKEQSGKTAEDNPNLIAVGNWRDRLKKN